MNVLKHEHRPRAVRTAANLWLIPLVALTAFALIASVAPSHASAQPPDVLYYKFNEGAGSTTANDAVPGAGAASATFASAPTWVAPGQLGAANITSNGLQEMATGWIPNIGANDFTIEFWINTTVVPGNPSYLFGENTSSAFRCFMAGNAGTGIRLRGAFDLNATTVVLNDGVWHHVAFVQDAAAGTVTLYVDGVLITSVLGTHNLTGTGPFKLNGYDGSFDYTGSMDEFRFWSTARTLAEIQANMNSEFTISATDPEVSVQRPAGSQKSNNSTDNVGDLTPGTPTTNTWTIANEGASLNLTVGTVTLSNFVNCTASVTAQPSSPVLPGTSTTFDIQYTVTAVGTASFDFTFINNDLDENPTTITVSMNGIQLNPNPTVLITEVDVGALNWFELTNVTNATVDISGWTFATYPHLGTVPETKTFTTFPAGTTLAAGEVVVVEENGVAPGAKPTFFSGGAFVWFNNTSNAVMLLDGTNTIIDFMCLGGSPYASITVPATVGSEWIGSPISTVGSTDTYQRIGTGDFNVASDWTTAAGSRGIVNTGLTLPFVTTPLPPVIGTPASPPGTSPLLITEADVDSVSGANVVEVQNVSAASFDATGWQVIVSDNFFPVGINTANAVTWTLGVFAADEVQIETDSTVAPLGLWSASNIQWASGAGLAGWAMLVDAAGVVKDFMAWGYTAAEIAAMSVDAGGFTGLNPGLGWTSAGIASNGDGTTQSLQRSGSGDNNNLTDWAWTAPSTQGVKNTGLTTPFPSGATMVIAGVDPAFTGALNVGDNLAVTFTATDPNSADTLTFTITETGGTLQGNLAGFNETFPYTDPAPGTSPHSLALSGTAAAAGTLQLTILVDDGTGLTDTITLDITITGAATPGDLQFSAATYSVNEDAGTVTITVQRVNGSSGAVLVSYATADVSATAGLDYTLTAGTLNWADGDAADKTFTVPILDDALVEGNEDFSVTLSAPGGGAALGTPSTATVTIVDIENGQLQFSVAASSVREDAGTATITVSRVNGSAGAVGVTYATSDGTATSGADYTSSTGTLSWAAGDTADKTFTVPILDDALVEGDETVNLTLSAPTGGATLGAISTAVLTITDVEAGSVQFALATDSVLENAVSITITATRTGGSTEAITVDYATAPGTATAPADYTTTASSLSWAAGDTADKTFTVLINDDALVEGAETFTVTLSNATGGAVIGTPNPITVTIIDDDSPGTLQFSSATYTVAENGGTATITVTRAGGSGGAVGVTYATSDGTATAGLDYTATTGTLSWAAGDTADKTFTVPIIDDLIFEGDETVILTLSAPTGGATLGLPNPATLTIVDDDVPGSLQFSAATYSVVENVPTATITVTRTGGTVGAVGVTYATSDGSATAGLDYTATTGTLSWAAGDAADKTFTVPIIDDALVEGPETVILTLSAPTGGASIGAPNPATLTITDDDVPGTLQFAVAAYIVNEDAGTATITVTRTGGAGGAVGVTYTSSAGTATAGADYTEVTGTLSWAAGDAASKSFIVPILDDALVEGDETVNLTLSAATGGAAIGATNPVTLTIIDVEAGSVQFSAATYAVREDGVAVTITVTRTGGSTEAITVDYATSDVTATAGADYTTATGTLSWAAGDAADKTFSVTILDDALVEGDETLDLTLSNPTGGAILGVPNPATLTITDVEAGSVQFSSATYSVAENVAGGTVTITVTRTGGSTEAISVDYATSDVTATAGADYTTATGTLSWAAGDAADKTFTVTIIDDAIIEPDETVDLTLSNPTGGATLGTPNPATLTIVDDDNNAPTIGVPTGPGGIAGTAPTYTTTVTVGDALDFTVDATDADPDTLTFSADVNVPGSTLTAAAAGFTTTFPNTVVGASPQTLTFTGTAAAPGVIQLDFTVDDGNGGTDAITLTITINDRPVIGAPIAVVPAEMVITGSGPYTGTIIVGKTLDLNFTATDTDATDILTFTITRTGGTLTAAAAGFNEVLPLADPAPGVSPHTIGLTGIAGTAALNTGTINLQIDVVDGNGGTASIALNVVINAQPISVPPKGPSSGSCGSFCFVVTASGASLHGAFGIIDSVGDYRLAAAGAGDVTVLRDFRHSVLMQSAPGRAAVQAYQQAGPYAAAAIQDRRAAQGFAHLLVVLPARSLALIASADFAALRARDLLGLGMLALYGLGLWMLLAGIIRRRRVHAPTA